MARRFAEISFTDSVKAAQRRHGTREQNLGFETGDDRRDAITEREAAFIAERDSFYLASHGTEADGRPGWPYVQHRGGPKGFLRVLDERTLGFADFRGNRQYLSTGNVDADDRVSLFLMDYANRRRLKIWARAEVIDEADAPLRVASLAVPGYPGRVEHGVLLHVEAVDWNCPQHITPRFTAEQMQPLRDEVERLRARVAQLEAVQAATGLALLSPP